jgi:hypothetical protein
MALFGSEGKETQGSLARPYLFWLFFEGVHSKNVRDMYKLLISILICLPDSTPLGRFQISL